MCFERNGSLWLCVTEKRWRYFSGDDVSVGGFTNSNVSGAIVGYGLDPSFEVQVYERT